MAHDVNLMNEGFEFLLEKLSGKVLLGLVDDPRFPPDALFNVIKANSRHPGQIVDMLGDDVLKKIDDENSLYSRLIDSIVITKYIENAAFAPYHYNTYSAPYHAFKEMPQGHTDRLIEAVNLLARWEKAPNDRVVQMVTSTFNSYTALLAALPTPLKEPPQAETTDEKEETEKNVHEHTELVNARQNLDWGRHFTDMGVFVITVSNNPFLSNDYNILHSAHKLLEAVENDNGKNPIPEDVKKLLKALLTESNLFRATEEVRQQLSDIEATLKEDAEDISAINFIDRYKTTSNFLAQYGRVIPRIDISRINKDFTKFSNDAVVSLAINFADPGNKESMTELCAAIASNEVLSHKFLSTLTSNTKDMARIVEAAKALTPNQP